MNGWPASVGVVGAGAMGRALASGLVRGRPGLRGELRFADAIPAAAEAAAQDIGGRAVPPAEAAGADVVVLAVKPKDVQPALSRVAPAMGQDGVLLSVVAGWTLERLAAHAPGRPIVRTMPNLAVRHGAGLVVMASRDLSADREERLGRLLLTLGTVEPLPESLFDAATGLAGCGPGFVALVAEALEEGGVGVGLSRPQARSMVRAVLAGTASLLGEGADPAALRQRVSSPAGATIEGIAVLERGALRAHLADAVRAAARRSAEL